MIWYKREFIMPFLLKGSQKIIYDALKEMLAANNQPSITALTMKTSYSEPTVIRALHALREQGLIAYHQANPGQRANYAILSED